MFLTTEASLDGRIDERAGIPHHSLRLGTSSVISHRRPTPLPEMGADACDGPTAHAVCFGLYRSGLVHQGDREAGTAFVQEPFTPDTLAQSA